jgi:hypothetical protein
MNIHEVFRQSQLRIELLSADVAHAYLGIASLFVRFSHPSLPSWGLDLGSAATSVSFTIRSTISPGTSASSRSFASASWFTSTRAACHADQCPETSVPQGRRRHVGNAADPVGNDRDRDHGEPEEGQPSVHLPHEHGIALDGGPQRLDDTHASGSVTTSWSTRRDSKHVILNTRHTGDPAPVRASRRPSASARSRAARNARRPMDSMKVRRPSVAHRRRLGAHA